MAETKAEAEILGGNHTSGKARQAGQEGVPEFCVWGIQWAVTRHRYITQKGDPFALCYGKSENSR